MIIGNRLSHHRSGVVFAALLIASCAQGPTAPNATQTAARSAGGEGRVQGSAAGDFKTGPVDMDISLVRVAQTDGVPAFYASPGGGYVVRPGLQVEIYVQIWTSNPLVQNPRLIVDWGNGEKDNIGCGSCRLTYTYNTESRYTVKVTLDDRVSSFTTRTFTLNVGNPPSACGPGASGAEIIPAGFAATSNYANHSFGLTTANGMRDGDFANFNSTHGTNNGANESITADLGCAQPIGTVKLGDIDLTNPDNWGPLYTNGAVIEGSLDGSSYTFLGTVSGVADATLTSFPVSGTYRYVRIRMASNYLGLGEFRVFAP